MVRKSPDDVLGSTLGMVSDPSNVFIRFTGGEPTLYWSEIVQIFNLFQGNHSTSQIPVLIQTNGVEIGKESIPLNALASTSRLQYLIELSFKGTNREEFSILTGRPPELYERQLKAYEILGDLSHKRPNLSVAAVLGIYHSSVRGKKSKYVFVNPTNGRILFDNVAAWDERFRTLWQSAELKWVEPLRMFPVGVWNTVCRRCGPQGAGILKYHHRGVSTNLQDLFPAKPKSYEYARLIVQRSFWS